MQYYWMEEKQFVDIGKQTVNKYQVLTIQCRSFYGSNSHTITDTSLMIHTKLLSKYLKNN